MSSNGGGFRGGTDEAPAQVGLTRRVVLYIPQFLFVMSVLANMGLRRDAAFSHLLRNTRTLRVTEPPIDVPCNEMVMLEA